MSRRIHVATTVVTALLVATGFTSAAHAAIFTVGSPSGSGQPCTHGTIQSAINAANSSPGADTIRLTRSLTYQAEANTIDTAQELTIEGGYATCTQTTPDGTQTVISGAGGATAPVFTINAPSGAWIRLNRLNIRDGDVAGGGTGGGIRFTGDGILEINDSTINFNIAGYGGGIHAEGTGSNAELVIGENVIISNNVARYDGGGVLARGIEMSMLDPGSVLLNNEAQGTGGTGGFGGGLFVHAVNRPSYAYIGSGTGIFGVITSNKALYGGGVAIIGQSGHVAELQLFATDPAFPSLVGFNTASVLGGGIYASSAQARARLWNASLDNNLAPNGAAVYLASSAGFYVNFAGLPPTAVGCTVGSPCGFITNNAANADENPGAIVYGEDGTTLQIGYLPSAAPSDPRGGVLVQNNSAGSVFGGAATTQIYRSIIGNNTTSSDVIKLSDKPLYLVDSTITGNTIGGGSAILRLVNSATTVQRSILWQPGNNVLSRSGGSIAVDNTVAHESTGLGSGVSVFNPRFVDPAHGDYGLRVGSRAVDFALALEGDERDAHGRPRDKDLLNPDLVGPRDLGALERQSLQPMVLNGDFDAPDLRLWTPVLAGSTTRDASQNASGAANSGSAHVTRTSPATGQETRGISQCIHLPGPAIYALNGWGRGTGSLVVPGDQATLFWEYRRNGGENCTGTPDASGWHALTNTNNWHRPAQPALINASDADTNSSITITLVAVEFGPSGTNATHAWFDGITLDIVPLGDALFADGFED